MPDIHIKRGASLALHFAFQNDDSTPFVLDESAVVSSTIADVDGVFVDALDFITDTSGEGLLFAQVSDTSAWPIGGLRCDVAVVQGGLTVISQTFPIYVNQPVTQLP